MMYKSAMSVYGWRAVSSITARTLTKKWVKKMTFVLSKRLPDVLTPIVYGLVGGNRNGEKLSRKFKERFIFEDDCSSIDSSALHPEPIFAVYVVAWRYLRCSTNQQISSLFSTFHSIRIAMRFSREPKRNIVCNLFRKIEWLFVQRNIYITCKRIARVSMGCMFTWSPYTSTPSLLRAARTRDGWDSSNKLTMTWADFCQ